jgi:hypothetical protein
MRRFNVELLSVVLSLLVPLLVTLSVTLLVASSATLFITADCSFILEQIWQFSI